ncbi:MAG: response regulator transcription factor [Gaiellaceae bacterium]
MSEPRPRAVAADVAPAVRSRLEQAGIEIRPASTNDLLAEAENVGATLVVASRRAAARALGSTAAATPRTSSDGTGDYGLSDRELDVLKLVATGKENAEIAKTLVISPKTVKNHVSRILSKLGLKNRVEAAVFAVKRGIA